MAEARQNEMKVNITVVATKTFTTGFEPSAEVAMPAMIAPERYEVSLLNIAQCIPLEETCSLHNERGYFAFCSAIQRSVRASSRSSGSVPPLSISSWNLRMSNFGPSSFSARSRSSRNLSCPIL
jgi:hypothetical protein